MNPARLLLFVLFPLFAANFFLWLFHAHNPWMAALWPVGYAIVLALADWSDPKAGLAR